MGKFPFLNKVYYSISPIKYKAFDEAKVPGNSKLLLSIDRDEPDNFEAASHNDERFKSIVKSRYVLKLLSLSLP
jgi:hypothetical protein